MSDFENMIEGIANGVNEAGSQDKLLMAHDKEGLRLYGKLRWNKANIGWGSDDNSISSKVYGRPTMVFTSYIDKYGQISHNEEKY